MEKLHNQEIEQILQTELKQWQWKDDRLIRTYHFKDFKHALSFMVLCGLKCEQMDHHPDWKNVYNKVFIELYTHTLNGISSKDVELAKYMEGVYQKFMP
ncbi:MAG: 4a-hydroxytetrahydrobiopterin dehydratase [Leptospiraceae bacterium]|nr:4a-hydroxytetrahydrobiopterin dehydratase [Leptospiraceae bacterium]